MEQRQPQKSCSQCWGGLVPHPPQKPVERKLTPSCSHRVKLPAIRTHPVIEEKGYYSELLSTEASSQLPPCSQGPETQQSLLCQAGYESNTPKVTSFKTPAAFEDLLAKGRHGHSTQRLLQTDFAPWGYTAKVQLPFSCQPGDLPRKLEIERRRRTYLNFDIDQLLKDMGIDSADLMLRHQGYEEGQSGPENLGRPVFNYLPLEVFDNEEFDVRTPDDWLSLGNEEGSPDRKPVPAKALMPSIDNVPKADPKRLKYCWQPVGVLDYDPETQLYMVHKADCNSLVRDAKGNPVVICGGQKGKGVGELQPGQYSVPRIRLNFIAEDPRVFAQRVQWAQRNRENTEALLLYHLAVDCMPVWSGSPSLDPACLSRIKQHALSTPGLKVQLLQDCVSRLESEISLEYDRTMNRINFDKVVTTCPEEFSHITLPQYDPVRVPDSGLMLVPDYPLQQNRAKFIRKTLLTKPEVISVLCNVRVQCNKVAAMSVFHIPFTKALRLDEFELAHSQTQSQLQLFLRDTWVPLLCSSIRYSLQDESMGWFCLSESSWEVYRLSKMYCLMSQIRFSLQDSLRFLVQDSLVGLGRLVLDACHSILSLPDDMVWGSDLINSPYKPKKNPMFLVDLVLDQTGVHYSTTLDNFEAAVVSLFDKGILITHNLPQLDKFVMKQMFISGTPQLQSVAMWEPAVVEIREKICTALRKATVPLKAYAREYERHLEVHNSDISAYIKAHCKPDQTPQEIKEEVDHHLQEKYRLDHTLPSSIVIGPFLVSVEATRQSLSCKRRGLANAVLDQFALRLRQQVDDSCAECKAISMKLFDKPNSIEELTEKRDWMKLIPEQVKGQEEFIFKVVEDYELIDEFFYNLSDGDFTAKWTAVGWPYKVLTQMEAVKIQHEEDEERFNKIQQVDQNNFQERLDSLQMLVAGFSAYTDIERTHEIANEVRRVSKQLKEAQGLAQLYNNRERLFGNPITNYDRLQKLTRDFQPFRDLWTTTSDWLRWQESWMNDALSIIDPELLERNVNETYRTMHKCIKQFKDIPACQNVATNVRGKVEDFQPYIPLIQGLRNPGMRSRHWEVLSERINMNVRPKANFTLARCLEMGMQSHVEHIATVAEIAGKEFAIEQAMVLAVIAEQSLPLSIAPVLVDMSQQLAADKAALIKMKLSRTAASYKMVHGLGHTFSERTISNLREYPFSLNVDESTCNINEKVLAMLVSYFDDEQKDVVVEHLGSLEVVKVSAASLEKAMCDFFERKKIAWTNLVSIMLDSCNVMRGSKSGLETWIRQNHCPTLVDVDGDSCHHIHNAAKKFAAPFDNYLEQLFADLHTDHQWASDQIAYLREIAEYMDIPATNPQRLISHRWLSAYDVGIQTKRLLPVYKALYFGFLKKEDQLLYQEPLQQLYKDYHVSDKAQRRIAFINNDLSKKGMTDLGKNRKKRVIAKIWVESLKVDLQLSVYLGVLPILKEYVMVFQGSGSLVHKLHDHQLQVFTNLIACFIKPEHLKMSPKALLKLDLADNTLYSPIYIGKVAEAQTAAHPEHLIIKDFLDQVTKAYVACGKCMQEKLPLQSKTLQALSAIDPVVRGHSEAAAQLKQLAAIMKHLLPEESDIQEIIRYNVDSTLPPYKDGEDSMVMWWAHLMSQGKYPVLSGVIRAAISIFHGPLVESSFSLMGDVIDTHSTNMNISTFDAIQTVKYAMKSKRKTATTMFKRDNVKFGQLDRGLCHNMRTAGRRDKAQRQERLLERRRIQAEYGCKKTSTSAEESKRIAQDVEKLAQLRHAAKQRNAARRKALESLALQQKSKKKQN